MEKKIGLEHTIRKVLSESIGGPNTDEFKGTPKPFLKPAPLIAPKKGDEHPDGTATLAQRGRAKIASSETMKKEETIEEGQAALKLPEPDPTVDMPKFDDSSKKFKKIPKMELPSNINKKVPASLLGKISPYVKELGKWGGRASIFLDPIVNAKPLNADEPSTIIASPEDKKSWGKIATPADLAKKAEPKRKEETSPAPVKPEKPVEKPGNDNKPGKVAPIRKYPLPDKQPVYTPDISPFFPGVPANPAPEAPKITPKRVRPDDFPSPGQDPFRAPAPVKTPKEKPQRPPDKDPFRVSPQRPPNQNPFPDKPAEVKPKAPPTELPKKLEPPPYTNPKQPAPAARPEVPGALPAAKPVPDLNPAPDAVPAAQPALAKQTAVNAAAAKASENLANQNKKKEENRKKEEKQQNRKRMPFSLSIPGINPQTISGLQGNVPSKPYLHYAQDYVNFGESNDADNVRRSIENVARPDGKTRVTKQTEIKQKIIDENVKRANIVRKVIADKKDSTVILKPKLKHPELDEN